MVDTHLELEEKRRVARWRKIYKLNLEHLGAHVNKSFGRNNTYIYYYCFNDLYEIPINELLIKKFVSNLLKFCMILPQNFVS